MKGLKKSRFLGILATAMLGVVVACFNGYAEEKIEYTTGSPAADIKLANTIKAAIQMGSPFAHLELASIYCGELCFAPNSDTSPDNRRTLLEMIDKIKLYGVTQNYTKSYAHFLLSDTFKSGYKSFRDMLANHMTQSDLEEAKSLAEQWKQLAKQNK